MDNEFAELDASQEWEIGEPLRRAVGSIPLDPGAYRRHALSEAKPLAQEALATLAFLEQRRQLTAKELRQARAIRRLSAALEEVEAGGYRGAKRRRSSPAAPSRTQNSSAATEKKQPHQDDAADRRSRR